MSVPARRSPTLQDVARRAGVSARTVSNVVHGAEHVNALMRERVRTAIEELDYRPSSSGRSLQGSAGDVPVITLVLPYLRMASFAELAASTENHAQSRGFRLILEETGGDLRAEAEVAARRPSGVAAGLAFFPLGVPLEDLGRAARNSPLVLVGDHGRGSALDHVFIDSLEVGRTAAEHLLSRGRRRLAFLGANSPRPHTAATARELGFRQALLDSGIEVRPEFLRSLPSWFEPGGSTAAEALLRERPDVDGIVAASDAVAIGALRALRRAGRRVPDDVAVVGVDDIGDAAFTDPALTTVSIDWRGMARSAVDLLVTRLAGDDAGGDGRTVPVATRLVVRASS